ncbi:hypothetical protein ACQJ22_11020 [Pseudomonas fragariae (ex Marin et al. 2024)]|uniref:hypothetical protein n=1 Tax=Pseudomonas TaxID=286 RepID=UPI0004496DDB|nr:hypothetical protein [Pseudomonas syringae]AKF48575.1 hypothetical protein PsyrB_25760 [Pseudomonas syringae pv. syringae B301D]EXL29034.1 hypothetical protein PssB301D_04778 [Pseudomonas syringae pv. syringae str. B301D-R]
MNQPITPISLQNISPFFQILVFSKDAYSRRRFSEALYKKVESLKKEKKYAVIKWHSSTDKVYALWISFREFPSWLDASQKIDPDNVAYLENVENVLVLIDDSNEHVFVHASNSKAEEVVKTIFYKDWSQPKVDIKKIFRALAESEVLIKSLGINNTFGAGGTAAEAKSYFSKNAKLSLTPSFDAGYSFSYCLGSQTDQNGDIKVFGCSAKKRKFWGTWTDGVRSFSTQCSNIEVALSAQNDGDFIAFLVSPVEVQDPNSLIMLGFYLDYVVPSKGVVFLEINNSILGEWSCSIVGRGLVRVGNETCFIDFRVSKISNSHIEISYANPADNASVIIANDEKNLRRKKRFDFIEYLLDEENYTILFEEGYAYREHSFWKDNRLTTPFKKDSYTDIDWSQVDIRKEASQPDDITKICIAEQTELYLYDRIKEFGIVAIIKDDGANEAADHLVVCKDRLILVHEKFSMRSKKGLRIDDLQVVASQLIKNIRYLFPSAHAERSHRFFNNAIYLAAGCNSPESLVSFITIALSNIQVQNECWIVQPGISKASLDRRVNNKMHILLSHLSSICSANNTKFKLFCNT